MSKAPEIYNLYCDESCHLENDRIKVMVLGSMWCAASESRRLAERIREKKRLHRLAPTFEIKWTKVSPAKREFYLDLVDLFFEESELHFRALIIPDKQALVHGRFQQTHDDWYYKMYFRLIQRVLSPTDRFRIYLDIKDTRSEAKVKKLQAVLCNDLYDFDQKIIQRVQTVRSHEVELMQLADLLMGAIGYSNRGLTTSKTKLAIIHRLKTLSHYRLDRSTLPGERKFNLFHWQAASIFP
jgi:hypothetical protein